MSRVATCLILAALLISCAKEDGELVCGKKDPLNELKWLKEEMSHFEGGPETNAVVLYSYQGREVLELQGSIFSSTNIHQYYCDGEKLNLEDPDDFNHYKQNRIETTVLYGTKVWE